MQQLLAGTGVYNPKPNSVNSGHVYVYVYVYVYNLLLDIALQGEQRAR